MVKIPLHAREEYGNKEEIHKAIVEKTGLSNFCASPWNSFHEGPEGLVSTCCKTREPIGWSGEQTFEEMFNSDHAKDVRAAFLRNERHPQCEACWQQEENGETSLNRLHGSGMSTVPVIMDLVNNTDPDGTLHKHKPQWLDFLWTSKCNMACLGCTPELSSTINDNYKREYALLNGHNPDTYHSNMTNWDNGSQHKVDYVLKNIDTIHAIHLNGGEPFIAEETYELLEELLKRGLQDRIHVWSHTNGTITKYKGVDIIDDYLVHWGDNATITMSNDGFGSTGEYARYGYKDKKWLNTYRRINESGVNLNIQTCWNIFNAPNIHELGEWFMDNCPLNTVYNPPMDKPDGKLTIWTNDTTQPKMSYYIPELREQCLQSLRKAQKSGVHPRSWTENLDRWQNWLVKEDQRYVAPNYRNLYFWYNGLKQMDVARGTDLCTSVPHLRSLYELGKEISVDYRP